MNSWNLPFDQGGRLLCLIMLLSVYCVIYALLLLQTDPLPYVYDNNETYSAHTHARNLLAYGVSESAGLTDEAVSPFEGAHPFVHTHQGNMPRFYVAFLHLLGLTSVADQVAVTTFTVGLATVVLGCLFFHMIAGTGFALLASALLITDYIYFAQWQVNTYRVWIPFLILATHYSVENYARDLRPAWLVPIALSGMLLFYYELVLAIFTAIAAALYAAWRLRSSLRHVLQAWTAFGIGAAISLAVLVAQLVSYMGWEDLRTDAELTFLARNFGNNTESYLAALKAFYGERNIAFFYNIGTSGQGNWWQIVWSNLVGEHARVLSPLIVTLAAISLAGFGVRRFMDKGETVDTTMLPRAVSLPLFAVLPALVFYLLVWQSGLWSLRGPAETVLGPTTSAILLAASVISVLWISIRIGDRLSSASSRQGAFMRMNLAGGFLLAVLIWILAETSLYDRYALVLWSKALSPPGGAFLPLLAITATITAWLAAILLPRSPVQENKDWSHLCTFLACGGLAAIVVFLVFPGYVRSGYLGRGETFLVVHLATLLAFAFYMFWQLATEFQARARTLLPAASVSGRARKTRLGMTGMSVIAGTGLLLGVAQWVSNQITYVRLLPPTQFSWLKTLQAENFRGKSVVSNTYAHPFAVTTDSWGYIDFRLASGSYVDTPDGFAPDRSTVYLWMADRYDNSAYKWPDLFVCFIPPTLYRAAKLLMQEKVRQCRDLGLVSETLQTRWRPFRHRLHTMDDSALNAWAIVELDWTASPYLRPLPGKGTQTLVDARLDVSESGTRALNVAYLYAQQQDHEEARSTVRVYRADEDAAGCPVPVPPRDGKRPEVLILEQQRPVSVKLPPFFEGPVVVSVTPASAHRLGQEYFSEVIWVGKANAKC